MTTEGSHIVDDSEVETPGDCHVEWLTRFVPGTGYGNAAPARTPKRIPSLELLGVMSIPIDPGMRVNPNSGSSYVDSDGRHAFVYGAQIEARREQAGSRRACGLHRRPVLSISICLLPDSGDECHFFAVGVAVRISETWPVSAPEWPATASSPAIASGP